MALPKSSELDFHISVDDDDDDDEGGQMSQQTNNSSATLNIKMEKDGLHTFSNFPDSAVDDDNADEGDETELLSKKRKPVWSFAYYQEFFDVDTQLVLTRIRSSLIPLPKYSLNGTSIKSKPDMFGPFWICATLVICVGVLSNLMRLISNFSNPDYHYRPEFQLLPIAATVIYCYAFIFPLLVRLLFWWRKNAVGFAVSQIICIYGYSLFILIPSSVLFLVPYDVFDWIVVSVAVCLSGSVIAMSLWPAFDNDSKKLAALILFILFCLHATVIVLLKLYFFNPSLKHTNNSSLTTVASKVVSTTVATLVSGTA